MAFRFSLELVLRVRQGLERRQELLLTAANQEVAWFQRRIGELDERLARTDGDRAEHLNAGVSAAELHLEAFCRNTLENCREVLHKQLRQAETTRDARVEGLRLARRERETLETLRERELHAYREQESRRAQRDLDDMLLFFRAYRS